MKAILKGLIKRKEIRDKRNKKLEEETRDKKLAKTLKTILHQISLIMP